MAVSFAVKRADQKIHIKSGQVTSNVKLEVRGIVGSVVVLEHNFLVLREASGSWVGCG